MAETWVDPWDDDQPEQQQAARIAQLESLVKHLVSVFVEMQENCSACFDGLGDTCANCKRADAGIEAAVDSLPAAKKGGAP